MAELETVARERWWGRFGLIVALLALALAPACNNEEGGDASSPDGFADPFAYCVEVRDVDAPDERYAGEPLPTSIIEGIREATGASPDAPAEFFTAGTFWRCMDGAVYACTVGANLPCEAKADTSTEPAPEMNEYCAANPAADSIPAVVTGRETVYAWACDGARAVAGEQVFHADDRGFLAEIWYRLEPVGER